MDIARDRISRRRLLGVVGAGGVGVLLSACGVRDTADTSGTTAPHPAGTVPVCVLTPEEDEGPFYTDIDLVRRDIREGRPGTPLDLRLRVVDAEGCEPIADASVDVWHADAGGLYSAFTGQGESADLDTTAQTFLRGVQSTDENGEAAFTTIYPGWYPGRTTHVHVKIHFADRTRVTSQLYFPDRITEVVYRSVPYRQRGPKDTANSRDYLGADDPALTMSVAPAATGYTASHTIGIRR